MLQCDETTRGKTVRGQDSEGQGGESSSVVGGEGEHLWLRGQERKGDDETTTWSRSATLDK